MHWHTSHTSCLTCQCLCFSFTICLTQAARITVGDVANRTNLGVVGSVTHIIVWPSSQTKKLAVTVISRVGKTSLQEKGFRRNQVNHPDSALFRFSYVVGTGRRYRKCDISLKFTAE
jgi:hypothetical protein